MMGRGTAASARRCGIAMVDFHSLISRVSFKDYFRVRGEARGVQLSQKQGRCPPVDKDWK